MDAYNAYNVVECLVTLARNYKRTVVMTIHQPRSNIYALFDRLVLLAKGRLVYSGTAHEEALVHFRNLGFVCPLGFNLADYLVDLTMHAVNSKQSVGLSAEVLMDRSVSSEYRHSSRPSSRRSVRSMQEEELFTPKITISSPLVFSPTDDRPDNDFLTFNDTSSMSRAEVARRSQFKELIEGYLKSTSAAQIDQFIKDINSEETEETNNNPENLQSALSFSSWYTNKNQASWWTQFKILSDRNLKNLVRNPDLLKAQYIITFFMALSIGSMYWKITNDVAGFQNRLGFFFFSFVLFAFMCIASIPVSTNILISRLFLRKESYSSKSALMDIIAHSYTFYQRYDIYNSNKFR